MQAMTGGIRTGRPPASLQRRVLAIAAVAFLAVAGLIGFSSTIVLDLQRLLDDQRMTLLPAVRTVDDYQIAVLEQQRGERGYVISADQVFLENYADGAASADKHEHDLRGQLAGDREGLRLLAVAVGAHQTWVKEAAEPAIAAVRAGAMSEAAATVTNLGRPRFEAFQSDVEALARHIDERLDRSQSVLVRNERHLQRLLLGAGLAAVVIVALVLAALDRWVIEPVERLSAAVRGVAAGNLSDSVSVVGPREVVELAEDVEAMRLRIVAELEEMRRANEALEQQAPLVVGLRDVLLPAIQAPDTIELASLFLPAEGVLAGDWFDLWTLEDGRVALVVVDISGHGADAGLFALRLKDLLVSAAAIFPQPGAALGWVASRLGDTGERFATIFLAVIDPDRDRMLYASAGHPPVLLASPSSVASLLPTGPLLGPLRGSWETAAATLVRGAVLVAYTDGLVEARSSAGEEFGSSRLLEIVTRLRTGRPDEIVSGCRTELEGFTTGRLADDVTLVAMSARTPPG
jgi:sigma-B regulation protein RsbU (phosphoserine phosphatase)